MTTGSITPSPHKQNPSEQSGEEETFKDGTSMLSHPVLEPSNVKDSELSHSATTLEYLAWGRQYKPAHNGLREEIDLPHKSSRIDIKATNLVDIPSLALARELVLFHMEFLKWHHNAIHTPTFMAECEDFWSTGKPQNPLWLALYFSVLSVSALNFLDAL